MTSPAWRFLGIPVLLLLAMTAVPAADAPKVSKKLSGHLGAKAVAVLSAPDKVEVFLIDSEKLEKPPEKSIAGYKITGEGEELKAEFAGKLATALLNDKTHFNPDKFSMPNFSVAFRVTKDKDVVEIVLALNNNVLAVSTKDAKAKPAYGNFDPMRPTILKLVKEALPKEKGIQSLK